ncbi:MAG TPA: hypothetical protein VM124_03995 [Candidatus Limnocylindrales bacterium]|nr:hypothetical protein [Candidatus Limnocylindrales bacterium]
MSEKDPRHEYGANAALAYLDRVVLREADLNVAAITCSDQDLLALQEAILHELEVLCPLNDRQVSISGNAVLPEMLLQQSEDVADDTGRGFSVSVLERNPEKKTIYGPVDEIVGRYQKAVIRLIEGDYGKVFRIRHMVVIGTATNVEAEDTIITQRAFAGYFESDSIIQPIEDLELTLVPPIFGEFLQSEDVTRIIDYYSEEVARLFGSTRFRRLPLSRQQAMLSGLIKRAEIESQVQDREVSIEFIEPNQDTRVKGRQKNRILKPTRHVYLPGLTEHGHHSLRYERVPLYIGGICIGIESLESHRLRRKPIRRDSDLTDKRAGLCLAIDPYPEIRNTLEIEDGQAVLVPISGQDFEADFN